MQDWSSFIAAVRVGGWVVYPLSVLAVLAIVIILDRAYVFARFSTYSEKDLVALPAANAFRRVAEAVMANGATPIWLHEAKAQSAAVHIERDMGRGLWVLETIVTAAPLLGLLGTIVGMMH